MSMDELLKELQQEYVSSIPEKINEIRSCLEKRDIEGLLNAFHKLKGSGKTYGVNEITVIGQFYENWLKEKGPTAIQFVPVAIDLLAKIHKARLNHVPFKIEEDEQFKKLENLK